VPTEATQTNVSIFEPSCLTSDLAKDDRNRPRNAVEAGTKMALDFLRVSSLFHSLIFTTFVVSGIFINCLQAIAWVTLAWHNLVLFRRVNYYLMWSIYAQILFLADWWAGCTMRVHYDQGTDGPYVSDPRIEERAIIVMNHHYEIDWMFGFMAADRLGTMGNARVVGKKSLSLVPVMGWGWYFSDCIMLARNWDKDKDNMARGIQRLGDFPDCMWLLLFCEGTRRTPKKLEASQQYARENNLPLLKHHLLPRTRGFVQCIKNMDRTKWHTWHCNQNAK
jgi:lysophosphatidic acid acyltransferase/lysophosphatidylinositol acyltransferase